MESLRQNVRGKKKEKSFLMSRMFFFIYWQTIFKNLFLPQDFFHFFWHKNFFPAVKKKSLSQKKKKMQQGKKCFTTKSCKIFLVSENISEGVNR